MNEQLPFQEEEVINKTGPFKKLFSKIIKAFNPVYDLELAAPTKEQSEQVDAALEQSVGKYTLAFIELFGNQYNLEVSSLDTREEEKKNSDDVYFINITGAWGRGPEVEAEIKTLACAMGEDGLNLDAVSLPGHGETDNVPGGWNHEGDFDFAADLIAAHIKEIKDKQPNRKIVINAWSMGGVVALKLMAKYPDLVDGVILVDTPVYPQNFKKLALRFLLYEAQKIRSVKVEPAFDLKTKLPGLGIFATRIKRRNEKDGIPFKVVLESAKSLANINILKDLQLLAEVVKAKNIPVLVLRGSNDFVIPQDQTTRLRDELIVNRVDCELVQIEGTGHALIAEQPVRTAKKIRKWLEEKELAQAAI